MILIYFFSLVHVYFSSSLLPTLHGYINVGNGAIFKGKLDVKLPLDQSARRSGYGAIRSKPKQVSAV